MGRSGGIPLMVRNGRGMDPEKADGREREKT
jgi:hypothetical protein